MSLPLRNLIQFHQTRSSLKLTYCCLVSKRYLEELLLIQLILQVNSKSSSFCCIHIFDLINTYKHSKQFLTKEKEPCSVSTTGLLISNLDLTTQTYLLFSLHPFFQTFLRTLLYPLLLYPLEHPLADPTPFYGP